VGLTLVDDQILKPAKGPSIFFFSSGSMRGVLVSVGKGSDATGAGSVDKGAFHRLKRSKGLRIEVSVGNGFSVGGVEYPCRIMIVISDALFVLS